MGDDDKKSFFATLPGILTGLAALIGAFTTLYVAFQDGQTQLPDGVTPKEQPSFSGNDQELHKEVEEKRIDVLIKQQTEKACSSYDFKHTEDFNGAFVEFNLSAAKHGTIKTWSDGYHTQYIFPTCRGIGWKNIKFTCKNGDWSLDNRASFYSNALCTGSTNDAQKGMIVGVE